MGGILAGDVAKTAADTFCRIDPGYDMVVEVEIFPVGEGRHRSADKVGGFGKPFFIHPVAESFAEIVDDPEAVFHNGGAHLYAGGAEEHEFRGVLPGTDAADARDGHPGGDGVL